MKTGCRDNPCSLFLCIILRAIVNGVFISVSQVLPFVVAEEND